MDRRDILTRRIQSTPRIGGRFFRKAYSGATDPQWVMHMKTNTIVFGIAIYLIAISLCHSGEKPDIFEHKIGIWEISGVPGQKRWIVIHNLEEAKKTGLFHIEVIGRDKGQPVWSIKHIRNHMAITTEALQRSIVRPLKRGAVYPESFDTAFVEWKRKATKGEGPICKTSIVDCLESK